MVPALAPSGLWHLAEAVADPSLPPKEVTVTPDEFPMPYIICSIHHPPPLQPPPPLVPPSDTTAARWQSSDAFRSMTRWYVA